MPKYFNNFQEEKGETSSVVKKYYDMAASEPNLSILADFDDVVTQELRIRRNILRILK